MTAVEELAPAPTPWHIARPAEHPGIILKQYIDTFGITAEELAQKVGYPEMFLRGVLNCEKPIWPELALILSRLFKTDLTYWWNRQRDYDLYKTYFRLGHKIFKDVEPLEVKDAIDA